MKRKTVFLAFILALCFFTAGCGSVLTYMSPLQSRLVTETSVQSEPYFHYSMERYENTIYITRTPHCPETATTYRQAQKRSELALPIAIGELPLFGFGLVDMLNMYAISESSKKEELLGDYATGISGPCGKAEKAPREPIVIRNHSNGIYHEVMTDDSGGIDLVTVLGSGHHGMEYLISPKSDPTVSFSFVY